MKRDLMLRKIFEWLNIVIFIIYSGALYGLRNIGLSIIVDKKNLLLYFIFYISAISIFIYMYKQEVKIVKNNLFLILFCVFITIMSVVFHRKNTVIQSCICLIGTMLYAMMLVVIYDYRKVFKIIFKAQIIITLANIMYTLIYPNFGKMMYKGNIVWRGLYGHKNSLSINMVFGIILSYAIYKMNQNTKMRIVSKLNIIISIIVLTLTKSITSLLIVIISYFMYILYSKLEFNKNPSLILMFLHIIIYALVMFGQKYNDLFVRLFNRDLTLTGRVDIWNVIINLVKERPIRGYGYGGVWYQDSDIVDYIWSKTFIGMETAHNGFLEWALQTGIIGMILFIVLLLIMGKRVLKIKKDNPILFLFSVQYITFILIFYITEVVFSATTYQMLILFILSLYINKAYKTKCNVITNDRRKNEN